MSGSAKRWARGPLRGCGDLARRSGIEHLDLVDDVRRLACGDDALQVPPIDVGAFRHPETDRYPVLGASRKGSPGDGGPGGAAAVHDLGLDAGVEGHEGGKAPHAALPEIELARLRHQVAPALHGPALVEY